MILRPPLPAKTREEMAQTAAREARGVTLAVAFDWSLASFLVALLVAFAFRRGITSRESAAIAVLVLICVPALQLMAEGLRRAQEAARVTQIAVSSILVLPGAAGTIRDLKFLLEGDINPSVSPVLLVVCIRIAWGLTRRQTLSWFAEVTPIEALRHHDRRWLLRVASLGVVVGVVSMFITIT
jgi:hypothetical protein